MSSAPKIHIVRNFPIEINRRATLRHLGYKPGSEITDRIKKIIDHALEKTLALAQPVGVYFMDDVVARSEKDVTLSCGLVIGSKQVSRMLNNCVKAVVFAATIGSDAEKEAARMMKDNPAEAVILDSAAGEAAEGAVEYLHRSIQPQAHRINLHLTPRFSPGYGDWPLEAQKDIFAFLNPNKIGIELTASSMMIPRKSVTGVLGLGPLPGIRTGASPCKKC